MRGETKISNGGTAGILIFDQFDEMSSKWQMAVKYPTFDQIASE